MAEAPQPFVNDQSFMNLMEMPLNQMENVDSMNLDSVAQEVMDNIEAIQQETMEEEEVEEVEAKCEERLTESPSTGEGFNFKCIFCDRILNASDDPKLLECLHNVCGSCLSQKLYENDNSKGIECTSCGNISSPHSIILNQFLLDASEENLNRSKEIKCSSCNDDASATNWCVDCAEFICLSCVQAHQRLKITKDHTIKSKEEGIQSAPGASTSSAVPLFCAVHTNEKLTLFCEPCDKLTCRDCQLTEHRDHKYKFTHEIADDTRKTITTMLKDVTYKKILLSSAMKIVAKRQGQIQEKKQAIVNEITQLVVRLTNAINVRGKQLVTKLNEVCEAKQKTLEEKKQTLEQLTEMTAHCIAFTQHALDTGSDMALLYSKKQVATHLNKIKSKPADIPNPEVPVRIHLSTDKIPEVIKVLSTIGQIVVDGHVYPMQATSPSVSLPSQQNSPSPSHSLGSGIGSQQVSPVNHSQMQQQQQQQQQHQQQQGPPPYNIMAPQQQQIPPPPPPQGHPSQHMRYGPPNQYVNHMNNIGQHRQPQHMQMHTNHMQRMQQQMQQRPMRGLMPGNRMQSSVGMTSQQQVTSSTHPQGLMHDRSSLRGLLQPNGNAVYVQTGPMQYQAVQPQYAHQFQNRFTGPNQQQQPPFPPQRQPLRMVPPNNNNNRGSHLQQQQQMSQQQQQQQQRPMLSYNSNQHQQGAKWHIPQQQGNDTGAFNARNSASALPTINDNFKIVLKSQSSNQGAVTSTIPKTPSPNHVQSRNETEQNLDRFCQDSVKDLMATIAKLDSNGVQVLAENRTKTGGSPHVDSSTGDSVKIKNDISEAGKDDPNEDWCAVCMDGGELVCCDKCPKVFHQACHIPPLTVEENDTWQCLLCMNFADISEDMLGERKQGELSAKEKKIAERIVLELYCQYDPSLPFREVLGPEHVDYHSVIKNPIALDTIKKKLVWEMPGCYTKIEDLVRDVRKMFENAYTYNDESSPVYANAKHLEKFFDEQLEKWLPDFAFMPLDDDELLHPPNKKFKRIITD